MTDEVGTLVVRNNYLQYAGAFRWPNARAGRDRLPTRLMQSLEQRGLLDRAVEFPADDVAIAERPQRGPALYAPELACCSLTPS